MNSFTLNNHDLLLRAGWEAKTTKERWQLMRQFRGSLAGLMLPSLPHELEDAFWQPVREILQFMMDDRICRYLMHPSKGIERTRNLMDDRDDPDEWMLLADDDPMWDAEYADDVWAEVGEVSWEALSPPSTVAVDDVSDEDVA